VIAVRRAYVLNATHAFPLSTATAVGRPNVRKSRVRLCRGSSSSARKPLETSPLISVALSVFRLGGMPVTPERRGFESRGSR
jgi:hypothetical protein